MAKDYYLTEEELSWVKEALDRAVTNSDSVYSFAANPFVRYCAALYDEVERLRRVIEHHKYWTSVNPIFRCDQDVLMKDIEFK